MKIIRRGGKAKDLARAIRKEKSERLDNTLMRIAKRTGVKHLMTSNRGVEHTY